MGERFTGKVSRNVVAGLAAATLLAACSEGHQVRNGVSLCSNRGTNIEPIYDRDREDYNPLFDPYLLLERQIAVTEEKRWKQNSVGIGTLVCDVGRREEDLPEQRDHVLTQRALRLVDEHRDAILDLHDARG